MRLPLPPLRIAAGTTSGAPLRLAACLTLVLVSNYQPSFSHVLPHPEEMMGPMGPAQLPNTLSDTLSALGNLRETCLSTVCDQFCVPSLGGCSPLPGHGLHSGGGSGGGSGVDSGENSLWGDPTGQSKDGYDSSLPMSRAPIMGVGANRRKLLSGKAPNPKSSGVSSGVDGHGAMAGRHFRVLLYSNPPFSYPFRGEHSALMYQGFAVDLWKEVARNLSLSCTYTVAPLHSALNLLASGRYDAVASGGFVTREHGANVGFSTSLKQNDRND